MAETWYEKPQALASYFIWLVLLCLSISCHEVLIFILAYFRHHHRIHFHFKGLSFIWSCDLWKIPVKWSQISSTRDFSKHSRLSLYVPALNLFPHLPASSFSIHLFLVEPHYPCYLRLPLWSGRGFVTSHLLLCQLAGGGENEREEKQHEQGGFLHTAGWGSFQATHCFVIVPMAFCPHWSAGKAARRD